MSRKQAPTLHIEWSSTCVAAVDIVTGQNSEAGSVAALGPILNGHKQALVGVSRSQVFLRTVRLPRAEPADLRRIVEVQLAHYFPLPPFELSFDCVQTADRTDEGFLTILAAIRTDDLKRLRADLKQVGISPTRTLPVALGAQAVAAHSGVEDAVVVSDSVTGLALDVVQGGALRFSRLVPTDSDPLTEAKRTLAGARIDDLPLLAVGELSLPGALPASGAALDRLHEAPEFDFELAEDRLRVARQQVGAATRRAVLLLAAAALLAVYVWSDRTASMAALESGQASWNRKQATLRSEERAESDTVQTASAIAADLKRAFHPAQPISDLMALIDDRTPANAWLTGLTIERGKPIQVRGDARTADDVASFVSALGSTPRLRDVKLLFNNSFKIENTQVVQFDIAATAVGNLPMPQPPKKVFRPTRAAVNTGAVTSGEGQ